MASPIKKIRTQIEQAISSKMLSAIFNRKESIERNLTDKMRQNFREEFAVNPTVSELKNSGNLVGELGLTQPSRKLESLESFVANSLTVKSVTRATARKNKTARFSILVADESEILIQSFAFQENTNRKGTLTQLRSGGTKPPLAWLSWLLIGGSGIIVKGHDVIIDKKIGRSGLPYIMNTRPRPEKNWRVPFEHASSVISGRPVNFVSKSIVRAAQKGNLRQSLSGSITSAIRAAK